MHDEKGGGDILHKIPVLRFGKRQFVYSPIRETT